MRGVDEYVIVRNDTKCFIKGVVQFYESKPAKECKTVIEGRNLKKKTLIGAFISTDGSVTVPNNMEKADVMTDVFQMSLFGRIIQMFLRVVIKVMNIIIHRIF